MKNPAPAWVAFVATIGKRWKEPGATIRGLFEEARPDLSDRPAFGDLVADLLRNDPELVQSWRAYSLDKRVSAGPYMEGTQVGFFDRGRRDVAEHDDGSSACADFLFREACWVLLDRRVNASGDGAG